MLCIFNVILLYFLDQSYWSKGFSLYVLIVYYTEFPFIVFLSTAGLLHKNSDVLDVFNSWGAQDSSKMVTVINTYNLMVRPS